MKKTLLLLPLLCLCSALQAQKWEGLADRPQMGWSSWNCFQCEISESRIRQIADRMVSLGLRDAGYVYLNLDDGWHSYDRDSLGFVQEDPAKFPSGMKALGDYLHERGLRFGIYSDAGYKTCACFPGSLGHEYQDALTYASWGVDYLKYDFCYAPNINPQGAYTLMRDALRASGRPIFFSICDGGGSQPWLWAADVGHSWRTTVDIMARWTNPREYDEAGNEKWGIPLGVDDIIQRSVALRAYHGPGHWNDPDMLEVGNGLTADEDRAHFSMWCMLAAPLILGNDLTTIRPETLSIVTNRDAIAIDQDPMGIQGLLWRESDGIQYWFKPLENGDWAFCLLNRNDRPATASVTWETCCLTDEISGRSTDFDMVTYTVRDLWQSDAPVVRTRTARRGTFRTVPLTVELAPHGAALYRLSPVPVRARR